MAQASFYTGTKAKVDQTSKKDGSLYFTTDTHEIILDVPGGERASFGGQQADFSEVSTDEVDKMIAKYFK